MLVWRRVEDELVLSFEHGMGWDPEERLDGREGVYIVFLEVGRNGILCIWL